MFPSMSVKWTVSAWLHLEVSHSETVGPDILGDEPPDLYLAGSFAGILRLNTLVSKNLQEISTILSKKAGD
jgi:hypothetical protein